MAGVLSNNSNLFFKFDANASESEIIMESIKIVEKYINTKRFKNCIDDHYEVDLAKFQEKLLQVKIKFSETPNENKGEPPMSWISNNEININNIFENRFMKGNKNISSIFFHFSFS